MVDVRTILDGLVIGVFYGRKKSYYLQLSTCYIVGVLLTGLPELRKQVCKQIFGEDADVASHMIV